MDPLQDAVDTYFADPTPRHREAVVLASVPLVRSLIGRVGVPSHAAATVDDMQQAGLLGLLQALDNYDPDNGAKFVTFAYLRVRGALVDFLRQFDTMSRRQRTRLRDLQEAASTLRQALGEEPSDQDVADFVGVPLADYQDLLAEHHRRYALSLHDPVGESQQLMDTILDEESEAPFEAIEDESSMSYLSVAIQTLPERQRTILGLYYYERLTLRQIGEILDLSEARISQLLGKTLLALRAELERVREPTTA
jgi:RNA polymerase sigma factor for flagellar operon FliA